MTPSDLVRHLTGLVRDPTATVVKLLGRVSPEVPWRFSDSAAHHAGLSRPFFLLSFDCDTDRDIAVVEDVHARLGSLGIVPIYAVPGELLERGAEIYRRIANTGAEFLNHGYRQHTDYLKESNTYVSTLFYDRLSEREIAEDVRRGHEAVCAVIGRVPTGFRTPHFGTYQTKEQLSFLYGLLSKLGYRYSTSTLPLQGLLRGPVQRVEGRIWELPVSGGYRWPLALLDSYGFRYHPGRRLTAEDYEREMSDILRRFAKPGRAGVLNYYADPSQVFDWPGFFATMALARPFAVSSYAAVLEAIS